MKELSKDELRSIQGGYENWWVKCTRALGYAVGEVADAAESTAEFISSMDFEWSQIHAK